MQSLGNFMSPFVSFKVKTACTLSRLLVRHHFKKACMITYEKIFKKPQIANSLIGMSLAEFEKLYAEFELAHIAHEGALQYTRRHKLKRRRAVGAGRKHKYPVRDRLLMT